MAGETVITVVGNLTADPELRFTPSGAAVANFTVASTPRNFDRQSGEWKDGDALFMRCNVWRQAAENVAETLTRGMRVMVSGRLRQRSFETREGEKRTVVELEVDEVGPSLQVRHGQGQQGQPRQWRRRLRRRRLGGGGPAAAPVDDPWGSAPPAGSAPRRRRRAPLLTTDFPPSRRAPSTIRSTPMAKPVLRKPKKKVCAFCKDKAQDIDYKDTGLLRKFISDRGKIRARRVTGNCRQHQRDVAVAVKNSREVALLPYTSTAR